MENSAIRKCTYLYQDVNSAQEVNDIVLGWPAGVTWLVTDFGGGGRGAEPPAGGGTRACAGGGGAGAPPARARSARAAAAVFSRLFSKKRKFAAIL